MSRPSPRRRFVSQIRKSIRRKPLWLEQLEDRVVPTVIDLTSAGATGALNGALFYQSSGTGINTFVRLATNQTVEQGYNTNFRPVQFDESTNAGNTRAVQLSTVPTVISAGGLAYYEFLLNINQLSSSPLLSVDELRFYVTNASTIDPTLLHNYDVTAHTLQDDAGHLYSPVYDLNPTTPAANYIKLDYSLATGNGTGDMVALLPVTSLGTDPNQYVYLYSKLGVHFANNDGYDEWSTADALPVGSVSGVKFVDVNGNGVRDAGEPAMAGVTVFLDANNNGVLDPGEVSTVTAADGSFSFSRLLAGTYHVREVAPAGWIQTASISADVTLAPGQNVTGVALGNFKLGTISGTKFEDKTGDGFSADDPVLGSSDPNFVPVTMQLLKGGNVVATTTTGSDGTYTFAGIGPGTYTVAEVKPNGWIQTAATGATITATSGFASTGNNFDNFLVAYLSGSTLVVRTTLTGSGTLTLAQNNSTGTIDVSESTASVASQSAGSFPVASIATIQITSNRGYTVDTTNVNTVPIVDNAQPGGSHLVGGASGTTVLLNSGSTDTISVTGGQNALNFSPTTFGVTFNAGMNQGQLQPLDSSGQHFLGVTGVFQTIVGTGFNDTLTAALPAFDPSTLTVGPGTTILSGFGQDKIFGTLGTTAVTRGSGSHYTQVLGTDALSELQSAIQHFGVTSSALGQFEATVSLLGGSSFATAGIMTNLSMAGTGNQYTQTIAANVAQVVAQAVQGLTTASQITTALQGFDNTTSLTGGFNQVQATILNSLTLGGGANTLLQALDSGSASLASSVAQNFDTTASALGNFGAGQEATLLSGFDTTASLTGGFNQVQTSILSNITESGGNSKLLQILDPISQSLINSVVQSFDTTASALGSFGAGQEATLLSGFDVGTSLTGGFNAVQTSILANVSESDGHNTFLQALDANSQSLINSVVQSFDTTSSALGSFGAGQEATLLSGFDVGTSLTGGFNAVQTSILANVSESDGHNTFLQALDANSQSLINSVVQSFDTTASALGSFGAGQEATLLSGFDTTASLTGGFSSAGASILANITESGGNNLFVQDLNSNSLNLIASVAQSFDTTASALGSFGAGQEATLLSGFDVTASLTGGFSQAGASILSKVTESGGNNIFLESLDANSQALIISVVQSFDTTASALGNFGAGQEATLLSGFDTTASLTGGYSHGQASILTNTTETDGHNTFLQALDANSQALINSLIQGFDTTSSALGSFGAGQEATLLAGFDTTASLTGGFNAVGASILASVTESGGSNLFFQALDANSQSLITSAIQSFDTTASALGNFGAGQEATLLSGFDTTASLTGGFNAAGTSILTHVTETDGNNQFLQALDSNSQGLVATAAQSFDTTASAVGNFGAGQEATLLSGFDTTASLTGGFNQAQASILSSVTESDGHNLFQQTLDANSASLILSVVQSFDTTSSALGNFGAGQEATLLSGFDTTASLTGNYNSAKAGSLTTVHESDGFDLFMEQLTASEITTLNALLATLTNPTSADVKALLAGYALNVTMGNGDEVVVGGLLGTFQAGVGNDRFVIEDPSLLGASNFSSQLLQFGGVFTAGTGNNTYYFVGQNLGHVAVNQAYSAGIDTLDFSRFQGGGIALNLGQTGEQTLTPGLLYLTLSDGMGISNVVGTGFSDTITLNGRNGTIMGQALLDPRAANAPAPQAVPTQVVFLDFDTYTTDPSTQHVYTTQERQAILAILQTDYALFPFVQFTMTAPTSGAFETIFFNRPTGTSEGGVGGNSSEIDFRNLNQSATAEINVNGFIGTGRGQVPAVDPVTGQDNWVRMSATIAAHELGHTMGEQHEFSYGPVGFGIHNPPGNAAYRPSYPGPDAAWETAMHIMASPASVGSTLFDAAGHPFFGEREAIALAYINDGTVVDNTQTPVANNSMTQAQSLTLVGLQVPNPATSGFEAGMQYSVAATDVVDYIGLDSTGHSQDKWYSFSGKQGDLMNFDVMSYHLTRITDPVDTVLTIYDSLGNVVGYYNSGAVNDDNFETADAHIIDLTLPADGTYYVKVDSFTDPSIQPGQPGYNPGEATDTLTGHYELLIYRSTVGNKINPSSHDTVVLGSGQDTIYGVDPTNPMVNPQAVTYNGVEGAALSLAVATFGDPGTPSTANFSATVDWGDGSPASAATVSISGSTVTILGSHAYAEEGTYTTTLTLNEGSALSVILKGKASVSDAQLTNAAVSLSPTEGIVYSGAVASFTDPGGSEPVGDYVATINWGDNSAATAGTIVSNSNGQFSVAGSHTYKDEGSFSVTVTITHDKLSPITGSATVKVSDAPLSATSSNVTLNQGLSANTQVAGFTDANLLAPLTDFTSALGGVTIAWGDGMSSGGTITQPGGVGTAFVITAGHAYGISGTFNVIVTITDVGGQSATTSFTVTVQPSIIVLNPNVSGALTLTGKVAINIAGAVLVDSNSTSALSAGGTSQITAGTIQVVGGVSANNGAILSPTPITGIKPFADPLATLTAPAGSGKNLGTINLTKGSLTISPGIYTQISVSGNGTTLTMNPGIYIIAGGGFSVANSSNVTGAGVMVYNAGSNFPNAGGTFGAISLGSSGQVNLSAPTTGPYAGVLIFQSRDNTRALSLNASSAVGINGTVYAPAALLSLGGSASLKNPVIVNQLTLNGNGGSGLTASGTDNSTTSTAGQLLGADLFLYVNDPSGFFNADELARMADTITGLDNLLAPYSVTITEVSDATLANLILDTGTTSAVGGFADGVLGCFVSDGVTGEITLIQGWNWFTGADTTLIGSNQYDFQSILTHEMGHALGLGHSTNPDSVMYANLDTGVARRTMTVQDLNIPDTGAGADGLHAAVRPLGIGDVSRMMAPETSSLATSAIVTTPASAFLGRVNGFGFTLADFSGPGLQLADARSPGFDAYASGARGTSIWSESDNSVDLIPVLRVADLNLADTVGLGGREATITISHPKQNEFGRSLNSVRSELIPNRGNEPMRPTSKPLADGFWGAGPQPFDAESAESNDSSSSGGNGIWDLEASLGWLFLGFLLTPLTEVQKTKGFEDPETIKVTRRVAVH